MNIHVLITKQAKAAARMPDAAFVTAVIDMAACTISMEVKSTSGETRRSTAPLNRVALAAFKAQVKSGGLHTVHAVTLEYDEMARTVQSTAFGTDKSGAKARIEGVTKY